MENRVFIDSATALLDWAKAILLEIAVVICYYNNRKVGLCPAMTLFIGKRCQHDVRERIQLRGVCRFHGLFHGQVPEDDLPDQGVAGEDR